MHGWSRRGRKYATFLLLAAVLLSLATTTVNAASSASPAASATNASPLVGATTHPIQYAIAGPPSMVDDGSSLAYFKAHGFSIVELVVPDNGTYQAELNTITALSMQPVIDVEMVIWNGGQVTSPISSFHAYFQSLENAGWGYVASEGLNSTDLAYMQPFFKGYVNYNCDECGLWQDVYINPFTVLNSWESYYPSEVPYIQNGSKEAAALGIKNGVMAGLWANNGGDNQIYANSLPGSNSTPSYLSMLNWSYANGIGFNQFCVWCGSDSHALSDYGNLEFPQIVANLQIDYPASTTLSATSSTTTAYVNQNFTINGTLSGSTFGLADATITLQRSTNNATYTNVTTNVTDTNGNYQFSNSESAAGTYYYRTAYAGNVSYNNATSNVVNVTVSGGVWGAWTSLGGQILAGTSPAACNVSGQTDWFVVGTNHQLYYASTGSPNWVSLGGNLTSSPAATSPSSGVIDVFARGTNGALYTRHFSGGSWGAWTSLGGQIPAGTSPAACSLGGGKESVFVEGTNGALYQNTWNGSGWSGWTNLGGQLTSSPAATSPASGVIDVFARGTNGALYTKHFSGTWGAWTSLGGQILAGTSPAACSWGPSREDVFVQGTNGALYQNTWTGTWTGWQSLGGQLTSSPAAASPASGTIDVFVRGTNGALYERIYTGG
jgi:hypothetical protein